jgi:beta-carotene hydroxylase
MTTSDVLDKTALASAKKYMADVAWPTVILGLVLWLSYVATIAMVLMGVLSLWLAAPIVALVTYASYTVAHDSVHGSISGNNRSLRWLNKALGYMAAWTLMIPLTAHRHEHMAHHRDTNNPEHDPDFPVSRMGDSVLAAIQYQVTGWKAWSSSCWPGSLVWSSYSICLLTSFIGRMSAQGVMSIHRPSFLRDRWGPCSHGYGCSRTTIPFITCFHAYRSTNTRNSTKKSKR